MTPSSADVQRRGSWKKKGTAKSRTQGAIMGADPLLSWRTGIQSTREELGTALGLRKAPSQGPFSPSLPLVRRRGPLEHAPHGRRWRGTLGLTSRHRTPSSSCAGTPRHSPHSSTPACDETGPSP